MKLNLMIVSVLVFPLFLVWLSRVDQKESGDGWDGERNIYEDYKKTFGEEPLMINGVTIMSDTDNTKE